MTHMNWLFVLFLATQLTDATLTALILNRGGRELNPIMRWAMDRIGVVPALVATKIIICAALSAVWQWIDLRVAVALILWCVGVCSWNASQYAKMR